MNFNMSGEGGGATSSSGASALLNTADGSNTLKLPTPRCFSGKTSHWENWSYVFKSYMSTFSFRFKMLLEIAEKSAADVDDADLLL